jgi:diaminopimelate epimerase
MGINSIPFHKFHGLGNDFVLIDGVGRSNAAALARPLAKSIVIQMGHRSRGIGFDQLLHLLPATAAQKARGVYCRLLILNTDGSRAEMCGNGLRAAALYVWRYHKKVSYKKPLMFSTDAGALSAKFSGRAADLVCGKACNVVIETEMGVPKDLPLPRALQSAWQKHLPKNANPKVIDIGNPHLVFFISKATNTPHFAKKIGPIFETHKSFPRRTNVEFVSLLKKEPNKITAKVHVWERGAGLTMACGTGAVAVAKAWQQIVGDALREVCVVYPGGTVGVNIPADQKRCWWIRGTAAESFSGIFYP